MSATILSTIADCRARGVRRMHAVVVLDRAGAHPRVEPRHERIVGGQIGLSPTTAGCACGRGSSGTRRCSAGRRDRATCRRSSTRAAADCRCRRRRRWCAVRTPSANTRRSADRRYPRAPRSHRPASTRNLSINRGLVARDAPPPSSSRRRTRDVRFGERIRHRPIVAGQEHRNARHRLPLSCGVLVLGPTLARFRRECARR